ncbi:amidohydrolase [Salinimonas sp. HHU 13199]|uniref:Amidohydrolase n=1 Tax=Salinimonas profundi TaxID=2729140 RepID=A0ABR8LS94_9ALTE|nr:amidohydrolase [Salinimonas profundi]MBD3586969.1 amidohydrolase [Salinimonas profundi]
MSKLYKKLSLAVALVIGTSPVLADTLLIKNVKGYTLDESGEIVKFQAMAVDDGKIAGLNPDTTQQYDRTVDGGGKTLLPGMIDAHGHLLGLGSNLLEVDLRDTSSVQQAVSKVAEYALANPAGEWITGRGWNQELWSDRAYPRASDLDTKIDDRPVWLTRVDGHAGWANSRGLELAGIDKDTQSPKGGQIVKDEQGNPTGVLIDNAMGLLDKHIPETGNEQLNAQLDAAGEHLLSNGVTAMHDAGIPHSVYDFYLRRAVEQTLPVRIYAMISATDDQLETMLENGPIRDADDFLFINSVKAYGDGALGSRGAALLEPYSDAPHQKGLMVTQPEDFPDLFNQVINAGFQLNFHAIGDRANRLALDQFEATFKKHGGQSLRNRIEHAQVVAPSDLARFSSLQVLPSMQPTHATSDKNMAEDRIGEDRMEGAYAWQSLLKSGIAVPLGSDFPVELANPFYGIHAAVTRQDRDNNPVKGWYAHEALSLKQAFKGFTLDAAYAAHMEDSLGTLTPGKWADFIIVDQDIFSVKPEALWKTSVEQTWVAGEKVFEK